MNERFTVIQKIKTPLYSVGLPVVIEAGQLLKDNKSGNIVAQLKFLSLIEEEIRAVRISMDAFDSAGVKLRGVINYQYSDLKIRYGEEFGAAKAILFPDLVTEQVVISGYSVITAQSKYEWNNKNGATLSAMPEAEYLSTIFHSSDLIRQYAIETTNKAVYVPIKFKGIWRCTCGAINNHETCRKCGVSKETVFKALDDKLLEEYLNARMALEKKEKEAAAKRKAEQETEDARQIKLPQEKREQARNSVYNYFKRSLKFAIPISLIIAVVIFVVLYLMPQIIRPAINYRSAQNLFDSGKYEDAKDAFTALDGYKDSAQMINECEYQIAVQLMNNEKYDEAISTFETLHGYSDSDNQIDVCENAINDAAYNDAIALYNEGKYGDAIEAFEALDGYSDSNDWISKCIKDEQYNNAVELMQNGSYNEALSLFRDLGEYQDAEDKVEECLTDMQEVRYNNAVELLNSEKFLNAYEAFSKIEDYKDSADLAAEALDKYLHNDDYYFTLGMSWVKAVEAVDDVVGYQNKVNGIEKITVSPDNIYQVAKLLQIDQLIDFDIDGTITLEFADDVLTSVSVSLSATDCPYTDLNNVDEREEQLLFILEQITDGEQSYCNFQYSASSGSLYEEAFSWNDRYFTLRNGYSGEFVLTMMDEPDPTELAAAQEYYEEREQEREEEQEKKAAARVNEAAAIYVSMDSESVKAVLREIIDESSIKDEKSDEYGWEKLTFLLSNKQAAEVFDVEAVNKLPNITSVQLSFTDNSLAYIDLETELPSDASRSDSSGTAIRAIIEKEAKNIGMTGDISEGGSYWSYAQYDGTFEVDNVKITILISEKLDKMKVRLYTNF